ncbi:MAG: cohesin domain-containing protein [Halobacteriota archaeon]|nr:cohesin domain-containing protein [Halobacteriota archaeon]
MKERKIIATTVIFVLLAITTLPVSAASTVVSISDTSAESGSSVTVPIMLNDVTDVKGAHILLSYDSSVVQVTEIGGSDLSFLTYKEINNSAGTVRYAVINLDGGLSGEVKFADVTLKAVGNAPSSSSLDLDVIALDNGGGPDSIIRTVEDATFTVTTDGTSTPTPTPISTPTPQTTGGGGGGGGGASPKSGNVPTDSSGTVKENITIASKDGVSRLTVSKGTIAIDRDGYALSEITISKSPVGGTIASYDFGPDGARFSPAITITISYDPNDFEAGSDLIMKMFDDTEWIELKTTVDPETNTASAKVPHFTVIALFAEEPVEDISKSFILPTNISTGVPISTPVPEPPAQWIMLSGVVFVIMVLIGVAIILNSRAKKE